MDSTKDYLHLHRLGIDTHQEPVVYMRRDCHVCRAEGFNAQTRIKVMTDHHTIIATLNIVDSEIISHQQAGLSEIAWRLLHAEEGEVATFGHAKPVESTAFVRGKLFGKPLNDESAYSIVQDIREGRYSDIQLAAYITACAGQGLNVNEVISITKAMVATGKRFQWHKQEIFDKHCVGGLPGYRTTPIVVAIASACGLIIPKTSSRAITSPAGTADTMEVMTPVTLSFEHMREVVEQHGACLAWGGSVNLSPTDDVVIRVERALDIDSEGQLVASVLSKKIAAGATQVLIDIPIGPTAKVRTQEAAAHLQKLMVATGEALGIKVHAITSDGTQPVGRGIGPVLEAIDVLAVLRCEPEAPTDLAERSLVLAGALLELANKAQPGDGFKLAQKTLLSGKALDQFMAICESQGGFTEPELASQQHTITASHQGIISYIDNRFIARLARLAGAPEVKAAGVEMHVRLGDSIEVGQPLFTLHADAPGELAYALDFLQLHPEAVRIEEEYL
ncbi:thymidine phosphorylase family protein [Zooshikella harenae]|uniref:Putative thymidine phosphorylase n=1 Tax=Zooshikella harenae TaxID=2827238 RepID=A0ABS5ZIB3_9GAMM|nr:thymidine phosphorylase family protein [Zooshikella harenae]MBU2713675.1 thymidine phosphorylase family protein [Zooshikella harenae]